MHLSVVVGTPNEYLAFGSGAGTARVTISRSVDGRDWQVAGNGLSEGIVRGASDDPLGYVAWGSNGPTALTWVSSDGAHWTRSEARDDFENVRILGVARRGGDLLAVGLGEESADSQVRGVRMWSSLDGAAWEPLSPTGIPESFEPFGVTAGRSGVAVWGADWEDGLATPTVLHSADLATWDSRAIGEPGSWIVDVAGAVEGWVAVGVGPSEAEAGGPPPPSAAWWSPDGLTWFPAPLEGPALGWLHLVVSAGGRFAALGLVGLDATCFTSDDGSHWRSCPSAPDTAVDGEEEGCTGGRCPRTEVRDIVVGPAGVLAVGTTVLESGDRRGVAWLATGR